MSDYHEANPLGKTDAAIWDEGATTFGDATFPFYNRPVSHYVNEITAAGFALRQMREVVINDDFAQRYPAYAGAAGQPVSMHLLFQAHGTA
jgi:hypothetical protein